MYVVVGIVVLAGLAGIVLLVRTIAAGDSRVTLLAALLVVATMVASLLAQVVSIYYKIPFGWMVVVAAAALAVVALFWLIGRRVGWKARRVTALVGLMLLGLITLTFVLIAAPIGPLFTPLFEARARQIADANGFDVLLPADAEMNTDYGMPVSALEDGSVSVGYQRFVLSESKSDGALDHAALEERAAPGERPVGDIGPGSRVADDAEYEQLEVGGLPALGVSYKAVTEEKTDDLLGTDPINILLFERDGVLVTLYSQGYMQYESDGTYTPRGPLSFEELVEIGESLRRVE